jgi:phosphatidylinositol alpha-mannosyltransferase
VKVALVSAYDYAFPGGVTEHIGHLAAGLRDQGCTVKILAPCSDPHYEASHPDFVRIGRPFPIPIHGSIARITLSFHLANRVKRLLREEAFDVVHLHEPLMPALPLTALRFSPAVNVGTFHAYARSHIGYYYGKPLLKRYVRKLHERIAVSEPARQFVSRYFPGDYHVVPNGIDLERFDNQAPFPAFRDGKLNLLFVGRLEQRKGLGYLLRAYLKVKRQNDDIRLIVVGDGPYRRWYANWVQRNAIPDIAMVGYVAAQELPRYYATADIFCAPNTGDESFGIVLLEAMASGKPIIASDIAGFRQVLRSGQEGLLVPRKSSHQLAQAVRLLIDDPDLRLRMGQTGLRTVQQYDWRHVVGRVLTVYQRAAQQGQPARAGGTLVHQQVPRMG